MIKVIREYDEYLQGVKQRADEKNANVEEKVKIIIEDVKINGDSAVKKYTKKYDCPNALYYEVPMDIMNDALTEADADYIDSLLNCMENITKFHEKQKQNGFMTTDERGVILGQRIRGLDRVGVYVPGGTAAYPSSVLMNTIPAKIAGVGEIIMVTPPLPDGTPNKDILVAAKLCGVDRVFLCGGAQAIAALAYGTAEIPRVSKIVGPGNIYVATAKKMMYGTVDIDMIAGPSEILIIADKTANPKYIAADLLSQAEHDSIAASILITDDEGIAQDTASELIRQLNVLPRKEIAEASIRDFGAIIVAPDMWKAVSLANEISPEHLEVLVKNPMEFIGKLDNAGSIFLGEYSPEPLGDYYAGPNHVLPTSGTARFFSPLSVDSFIKKSSYIYYTKEALFEAADDIIRIAEKEKLTAHANSIRVRINKGHN